MQNQIPNNWRRVRIKDVCYSVIDCVNKTAPTTATSTSFKMIRTTNIKEGWVNLDDVRYVTEEIYKKWTRRQTPQKGDVLLTREAPLGEVGMLRTDDKVFLGQRVVAYRTNPTRLNNKFLLYLLLTTEMQMRIKSMGGGSTIEHMRVPDAENILLELPPIEIQQKIASILLAFDDKIEVNNKISKTLEEMAQTLFRKWFVDGASSEWKRSKFENYARLEYGKALQEGKRISGEVLVFGSSGQVGTHNEKLCSGPGIVVGRKGNVGSVFWVDEDFYPIDTTFYINSKISLYYIYFVLKNTRFHIGDSAVPGLNRESVHSLEILVPDEHTLKNFENIVSSMFRKLAEIKKENQKLAALRNFLLPKLMKGEINV